MANICNNELSVYSENKNNLKCVVEYVSTNFKDNTIEDEGCNSLLIYFSSKWTFPEKEMNELYNNLPDRSSIEMTCLSVEWGNRYCEFNDCNEYGWHNA